MFVGTVDLPGGTTMRLNTLVQRALVVAMGGFLLASAPDVSAAQHNNAPNRLNSTADRDSRRMDSLKEEVRHQLVMLPYYSVFDWLQADVKADGTVTLMGEVTRPTTKDDAEARVKK